MRQIECSKPADPVYKESECAMVNTSPRSRLVLPVVYENQRLTKVYKDGIELFAICIDLGNGKIVHDIKVFNVSKPQQLREGLNTYETPTPIIEKSRVYVDFGACGTARLNTKSCEFIWDVI